MVDGAVSPPIENVLLVGSDHGCRIAGGRRGPRSGGPSVAVERSIPVDMVDRPVGPPIKNMLVGVIGLVRSRSYHGYWVASGGPGAGRQCPMVAGMFFAP